MIVDSFLKIGHSHTICQDYILSGIDPVPYIILSDGCSQAADSDIGARILCHVALSYLKKQSSFLHLIDYNEIANSLAMSYQIAYLQTFSNLPIDNLDATLILAFKSEDLYHIYIFGDGVFAVIDKDNELSYTSVSYIPNAPAYLRYRIKGKENYNNCNVSVQITTEMSVETRKDPFSLLYWCIPVKEVKSLFVCSDGIQSFIYKQEETYRNRYLELLQKLKVFNMRPDINTFQYEGLQIELKVDKTELVFTDIITDVSQFKLLKGPFLSRRIKKVLKEYTKLGFVNDDDLSIGCFHEE